MEMSATWAAAFILLLGGGVVAAVTDRPVFDVPELEGIVIDGDAEDWDEGGFRVEVMADPQGHARPPDDLDARFRLAWDQEGLVLLVEVQDDVSTEADRVDQLYTGDCVQAFVADEVGSQNRYQLRVAPGADPRHEGVRTHFDDHRPEEQREVELAAKVATSLAEGGYVVEARLPWQSLSIRPEAGAEIGFQLYVADSDSQPGRPPRRARLTWFPSDRSNDDAADMHRVRLAAEAGSPVEVVAAAELEPTRGAATVRVLGVPGLAGQRLTVQDSGKVLAGGEMARRERRAAAELPLPMPPVGQDWARPAVHVGQRPPLLLGLPSAEEARARAMVEQRVVFDPFCFAGAELPGGDFSHPLQVENLIGPYEVSIEYYDADFRQVTSSEQPGRYGAVLTVVPQRGRSMRRFRTLCRLAAPLPWFIELDAEVTLPRQLGVATQTAAAQARTVRRWLGAELKKSLREEPDSAVVTAGLQETATDAPAAARSDDVWAADRQWWVTLKRKLYGTEQEFPEPFVCPRPIEGGPARVVREGTPQEAGVQPDAAKKIDAVCREWAADSDEGFAVCVARRGVIVLHEAYGERDGRPMTVETGSWVASVTKLLSGTLFMMVVDQGLADLDDPVSKYLPPLRGIEQERPVTIRHLFTHTAGLWGHWGDEINDLEEVIAGYWPHLEVGERFEYQGAGYALAGKIVETVTGEAIPQFYQRHLLGPLGCGNTLASGTYGDAMSVPLDMARIGQMLLNRGAYGEMRFFSPETFAKMMPVPLKRVGVEDADVRDWKAGVGNWYMKGEDETEHEDLSESAFGHKAASCTAFIVDPERELVIVMTRNTAGRNFEKYHTRFIEAVLAGIVKDEDS
ncbi:MAG: serine hydrolase [Planctomycetota bacterium]|jgi:CubicO group peptidase (beta-lactamase class C family)